MATKLSYPLADVLRVKIRRVEEAEKVLKEKLELLRKEQEILEKKKAERDKVVRHHDDKLSQLRSELDHGSTSPKIQQMKAYLKVVKERVASENKKVKEQEEQVQVAEKNVEIARKDLARKRLEVDKLETHKADWHKEMLKELEIIEGREQDELGQLTFDMKKRSTERFRPKKS